MTTEPNKAALDFLVNTKASLQREFAVSVKKPKAPGETSYYSRENAAYIKQLLDDWTAGKDKCLIVSLPQGSTRRQFVSAYSKLQKGWKYLIDHLDPNSYYKTLKDGTIIKRNFKSMQFVFTPRHLNIAKKNLDKLIKLSALSVSSATYIQGRAWRDLIHDFIESDRKKQTFIFTHEEDLIDASDILINAGFKVGRNELMLEVEKP